MENSNLQASGSQAPPGNPLPCRLCLGCATNSRSAIFVLMRILFLLKSDNVSVFGFWICVPLARPVNRSRLVSAPLFVPMAIAQLKELPKWECLPTYILPKGQCAGVVAQSVRSKTPPMDYTSAALTTIVGVESLFGNERFPLRLPS
jgi:hypothetical protein